MTIDIKVEYLENYNKKAWGELIYQHEGDAGFDLRAASSPSEDDISIIKLEPFERKLISTGIKIEIPIGYHIEIRPRSGICLKQGLTVLNSPGTIDSGYRGEIKVLLINLSKESSHVNFGERIAQAVLIKHETAKFISSQLSDSNRGSGGFGSTGII